MKAQRMILIPRAHGDQKVKHEAGERAQCLRACIVPRIHKAAHKLLVLTAPGDAAPFSGLQEHSHSRVHTRAQAPVHMYKHTCIHTIKKSGFWYFLRPGMHSIVAYNSSSREVETGGLCVPSQ